LQRNFGGANRVVINGPRDRQHHTSGWMFIGEEPLLSEELRRQIRPGEPMPHKIASLHAIAAVERGEFVGKRRCRQLGEAYPICVVERSAAMRPQAAVDRLTVAQHAPVIEISNEVALLHNIQPHVVRYCRVAATCAPFKASEDRSRK